MSVRQRFTDEDVAEWEREGVVLLRDLFTPEECAAVRVDFDKVFGRSEGGDQA